MLVGPKGPTVLPGASRVRRGRATILEKTEKNDGRGNRTHLGLHTLRTQPETQTTRASVPMDWNQCPRAVLAWAEAVWLFRLSAYQRQGASDHDHRIPLPLLGDPTTTGDQVSPRLYTRGVDPSVQCKGIFHVYRRHFS